MWTRNAIIRNISDPSCNKWSSSESQRFSVPNQTLINLQAEATSASLRGNVIIWWTSELWGLNLCFLKSVLSLKQKLPGPTVLLIVSHHLILVPGEKHTVAVRLTSPSYRDISWWWKHCTCSNIHLQEASWITVSVISCKDSLYKCVYNNVLNMRVLLHV